VAVAIFQTRRELKFAGVPQANETI